MKYLSFVCFFACATILSSCSSSNSPVTSSNSGPWAPNSQTYQVTYGSNTVLIDSVTAATVIRSADTSYNPDDSTIEYLVYHMNSSSATAQNLATDQILLIYGQSIRHVDSVVTNGSETLAYTSDANLTDAIESGNIAWDYGFDYNANISHPSIVMPGSHQRIPMQVVGNNTFKVSFPLGDYKGTIQMTLNGENAQATISLEKDLTQGVVAKLTCNGTLERFRQKTDMSIASHQLQTFHHLNQGMKADLTLNATVAASGSDLLGGIDLPIVLLEVPYMVGPILVQMKVSAKFVVNSVVPVDGSAQLETHFTYNSDVGFKYEGTDVSANAQIGDWKMEKNQAQVGASSTIGVNFGLDFPKLSLDIMHKTVVLYAQTGILTSGDFTFSPACLRAQGAFVGSVGYNLSLLGLVDIAKGSMTLWNQQTTFIKTGNCP